MRPRTTALALLAAVAPLATGCTTWGSRTVYGPPREIGRRYVGSPSVAETSSSSLSAGFGGARGNRTMVAGLSGSTGSIKRTHCVQQAEIEYEQPYEVHPTVTGRGLDLAGGITLGVLGLSAIASASPDESIWDPGDMFYEEPRWNTGAAVVGAAMLIGGVALLGYSYSSLPKQPRPQVVTSKKTWVDAQLVESTGCGLPGDPAYAGPAPVAPPVVAPAAAPAPAAPAPADDVAARLQKLDTLRRQGVITEAEYQRKRKQILDGI